MGCWAFAEAFVFADTIGIGGLGESQIEAAQQMIEKMRAAPIWLLLAVFALCPGVVEELCFRGYFFRSLERDFRPYSVVLITAILFGLFHVITGNALLIERLIPSTLMGLVIGWVALRTGSVLPGMVIHFVHNALLNLVYTIKNNWISWVKVSMTKPACRRYGYCSRHVRFFWAGV